MSSRTFPSVRTVPTATLLDWLPVGVLPPVLIADAAISGAPGMIVGDSGVGLGG